MVRLTLKEPFDGYARGVSIERPAGVAEILVSRQIAEYAPEPEDLPVPRVTFRKKKDAV